MTASNETIVTYEHGGHTYEIDHLGAADTNQWGQFAVYRDGGDRGDEPVAEFRIPEAGFDPRWRPKSLPLTSDELIQLARAAVADDDDLSDPPKTQHVIRAKWILDGATTLAEAAQRAQAFASHLQALHDRGYVLEGEISDDYGTYRKP